MNKKRTLLLSTAFVLIFFVAFTMPLVLAAPTVTTDPAYNITDTSATLQASFNVDNQDEVDVFFQIGDSYTSAVEYGSSGTHTHTVTGLSPGTEYQYRAVLQYTTGSWWWKTTYTVYGGWETFTTTGEPGPGPTGKNPILFVHGMGGSALNWEIMMSWFESVGYSSDLLYAYTFNNPISGLSGQNVINAGEIEDWVNYILSRTGASEVDIIGHSMGGLSSRYYIKYMGGALKVDDYVSLGTPQHGTVEALFGDMRIGSSFLSILNSGDETPSGVEWTTVRTLLDEFVIPIDSAMLNGANNYLISGVGHIGLLSSIQAFTIALAAVTD